jgi:hypothetical protein
MQRGRFSGIGRLACFITLWSLLSTLVGCAGHKITVDDGRKVDETLLAQIRAFGAGERLLRPAIARSAELRDRECDKQWELPFSLASAEKWSDDDRVAWVRGLGVDERPTVVAVAEGSPLRPGARIEGVAGLKFEHNAEKMLERMADLRDAGKPFQVQVMGHGAVAVAPFQVCRGYTRFAPPSTPLAQDYHWLLSIHPLELTQAQLSADEALWMVLWTQGLSEEGGARMKTYHYGTKIVGTLYNVVTLATGLKGAALAAEGAMRAAQYAATKAATELAKQQIMEQARQFAIERLKGAALDVAERTARATAMSSIQQAAVNRGALGGVARVGATVFDRADAWALERMVQLQADPLAGFTLHQKLAEGGLAANAFVFDAERLGSLNKVALAKGMQERVAAVLKGMKPEDLMTEQGAMPLASARTAFSYEDPREAANQPFAFGLVAALLEMPMHGQVSK